MGRAIDMENDIDAIKLRVEKLENIVRGMSHTMSETKHIDIIEETKTGENDAKEEKTNNEGNGKSSVKPNKRKASSGSKTTKSWVFDRQLLWMERWKRRLAKIC